ncbi:MAG: GTPase ObgE [Dehalococcoidia bacterium]
MIIDLVIISIVGGQGGGGAVSFRREKGVPRGGPDGGNGGDGGAVYLVGAGDLSTLASFRGKDWFIAARGVAGRGKKRYGKKGSDLEIRVPCGTQAWRLGGNDEARLKGEVLEVGGRLVIAKGGKGGRGNAAFVTATDQTPYIAERGEEGEKARYRLELRILADVGIIGKPNAGKSTFLAAVTAARPKVAGYPFTTVEPVLGVASVGWRSFVLAEIPGLLEGAHRGIGLGDEFLRHATRTKVLIHIVDGSVMDVAQAVRDVNRELETYGEGLAEKQQVVVVNKIDMDEVSRRRQEIKEQLGWVAGPVLFVSAAVGTGVAEVLKETATRLDATAEPTGVAAPATEEAGEDDRGQVTVAVEDGTYVVQDSQAIRLVAGSDLAKWAGRVQVKRELDHLGVTEALEAAGVRMGDTVRFGDIELEW